MLRLSTFWAEEKDAPLMGMNQGFITESNTSEILERMAKWPALVEGLKVEHVTEWPAPSEISEEHQRIVARDAERTFRDTKQREVQTRVLTAMIKRFNDYQQGLGYVASLLLLGLDESTTFSLVSHFNSEEHYIKAFWKQEAIACATDAFVFQHLLKKHFPKVAAHLDRALFPDTYAQKWFSGLCIHVLPFRALFPFFESFLQHGSRYLFQFALSLIQHLEEHLLKTEASNAAVLYDMLRLDPTKVKFVDEALALSIVEGTVKYESALKEVDLAALRAKVYNETLKPRLEAAKRFAQAKKEEEEDDEDDEDEEGGGGEECQLCHEMTPELVCN